MKRKRIKRMKRGISSGINNGQASRYACWLIRISSFCLYAMTPRQVTCIPLSLVTDELHGQSHTKNDLCWAPSPEFVGIDLFLVSSPATKMHSSVDLWSERCDTGQSPGHLFIYYTFSPPIKRGILPLWVVQEPVRMDIFRYHVT